MKKVALIIALIAFVGSYVAPKMGVSSVVTKVVVDGKKCEKCGKENCDGKCQAAGEHKCSHGTTTGEHKCAGSTSGEHKCAGAAGEKKSCCPKGGETKASCGSKSTETKGSCCPKGKTEEKK